MSKKQSKIKHFIYAHFWFNILKITELRLQQIFPAQIADTISDIIRLLIALLLSNIC